MSAADRLNEIEARANAATRGPWHVAPELCGPDGQGVYTEDFGPVCEVGDPYPRGDNNPQESMYFIAHARTDVPALVAAPRAVLEVHAPDPYCGNWHHNPHRCPCAIPACADGCDTYPCPTVRAIEEALNA